MTFMDSLAANPTGSSNVYGSRMRPVRDDMRDVLNISNRVKDRDMQDFMKKAQFMSELGVQQDRQRRIFDSQEPSAPQDVVFQPPISDTARSLSIARDLHGVDLTNRGATEYQRGQLGLRQQQLEQQRETANRKLNDTERNTLIREIREDKNLSDEDKIRLQGDVNSGLITHRGQIESSHITKRGEQQRETEELRQTGRETLEDTRARHSKELAETQSNLPPRTSQLPSQQIIEQQRKYNILINRRPELKEFIQLDPNSDNMPVIMKPSEARTGVSKIFGSTTKGPTKEQWEEMNNFIFGSPSDSITSKETETKKTDSRQSAINELTKAGKPITEANINYVIQQLGK